MQPLLLLHGALGAKSQLFPLQQHLTTFNTHAINFSGHGGTPLPHEFSIPQFAADVINYLDTHQIKTAHFFGYSMGGYVALYLAATHPERVGKVFTLATKFNWTPQTAEKESGMLVPEKIEQKIPAFAEQLKQRHAPQDWKQVLHKTADMMLHLGNAPTLTQPVLTTINQTITLAVGGADKMVTVDETKNVQEQLKNSRFLLFENWAHPIEQIDIKALAAELNIFFG